MNYKFIPDSIKIDDSIPLNYSLDEFLELQISYKQSFEKILTDIVDFAYFDNWVKNTINDLPIVNDKEANFYRKFSTLNSDYIYLRNNIHIEKLDFKELNELYFKGIVPVAIGEKEGIRRKPAPDTVFEALKELRKTKEEAVYVGDSDVDIETAKNAGMPCISVLWGFRDKEFLDEHGAMHYAKNAEDVLGLVEML